MLSGADRQTAVPGPPLAGKVVVVTGAGRGLGQAIALACGHAGAFVVGTVRSKEAAAETQQAIEGDGHRFEARIVDLRDSSAVRELSVAVEADHGTVDVLVNNSGIAGPTEAIGTLPDEDWAAVIDVNLTGIFRSCRAFLPRMIENGAGSIINVGSISAQTGLLNRSPYTASKAGITGFTRTLALEAGLHGVRANTVSPGPVDGARIQEVIEGQARATGRSPQDVRADFTARSALRRFVTPDEVARAVVFLGSDASSGITGVDLLVTAGYGID